MCQTLYALNKTTDSIKKLEIFYFFSCIAHFSLLFIVIYYLLFSTLIMITGQLKAVDIGLLVCGVDE